MIKLGSKWTPLQLKSFLYTLRHSITCFQFVPNYATPCWSNVFPARIPLLFFFLRHRWCYPSLMNIPHDCRLWSMKDITFLLHVIKTKTKTKPNQPTNKQTKNSSTFKEVSLASSYKLVSTEKVNVWRKKS